MKGNYAFIDGQNLYLGTKSENWKVDLFRFRTYLKDKFHVTKVYYFLGVINEDHQDLYSDLQEAGFIIVFREHHSNMEGKKKGNVDVDICFTMMRLFIEDKDLDKMVLVSGDGDYIKLVKYFIKNDRFEKILFPNNKYSSLYKQLQDRYSLNLSWSNVKRKIEYKKRDALRD